MARARTTYQVAGRARSIGEAPCHGPSVNKDQRQEPASGSAVAPRRRQHPASRPTVRVAAPPGRLLHQSPAANPKLGPHPLQRPPQPDMAPATTPPPAPDAPPPTPPARRVWSHPSDPVAASSQGTVSRCAASSAATSTSSHPHCTPGRPDTSCTSAKPSAATRAAIRCSVKRRRRAASRCGRGASRTCSRNRGRLYLPVGNTELGPRSGDAVAAVAAGLQVGLKVFDPERAGPSCRCRSRPPSTTSPPARTSR
jgi:hypothetical protein